MYKYINEKLLSKNNDYIFSYKNGCIYLRNAKNFLIVRKIRIHNRIKSLSIMERLLRLEPRVALPLDADSFIFTDLGKIYKYNIVTNSLTPIHCFRKGMNNPLALCARYSKTGNLLEILYGEYIWNKNKGPVSIYKYDLNHWNKIYSFPANTITHIHNIVYDKYKNRYIILTGDSDDESVIWEADVNFDNVNKIVGGSQKYRACVAFPTENGIYYATDTPLENNYLYLLDNDNEVKQIFYMPGPCIYGRIYKDTLYMATSVEGNPELGEWRYRLSNKLGKGVSDRKVHIFKCDKNGNVLEIGFFRKDVLPMWLFQFGNAQFPAVDDAVYISTQSTVEKGTYKLNEEELNG